MARPTTAEVSLSALRHNYRTLRSLLPGSAGILAVVKAGGYGHGALAAARAFLAEGARMLGVATLEEGLELREGGIEAPVLVLGEVPEGRGRDALRARLASTLFHDGQLAPLSEAARAEGIPFPVHVKFDTGMGRLGFFPSRAAELFDRLAGTPGLLPAGVMTHLSCADGGSEDDRRFTEGQLEAFAPVAAEAKRRFGGALAAHALNSAGILRFPGGAHDLARPGILLYGSRPAEGLGEGMGFRSAMRLSTRVVAVKELPPGHPVSYGRTWSRPHRATVAVVPIGYADGYRRSFSSAAWMGVGGRRAFVAGRVCMDHTMIDVTGFEGVVPGTEVVVMGDGGPSPEELAAVAGTIPYEILTQVGRRVPRVTVA